MVEGRIQPAVRIVTPGAVVPKPSLVRIVASVAPRAVCRCVRESVAGVAVLAGGELMKREQREIGEVVIEPDRLRPFEL
jgi:hypothetical protein